MRDDEAGRQAVAVLSSWFVDQRRDLPWRRPGIAAWDVLVSEVMLQQTPVSRVVPAYEAWLVRWPGPADLAAASAADVLRQWGRLGYPRRALRLQQAAAAVVERHSGTVPTQIAALLALPGVGEYTARAVAAFAHGARVPVVDTNVRRVVGRWWFGQPVTERLPLTEVERLLPDEPAEAVLVSAALMELGAVVCTARAPRCSACPLAASCAWLGAGAPAAGPRARPAQRFEGTVRQARGRVLAVLREGVGQAGVDEIRRAVSDDALREAAVAGLVSDGLAVAGPAGALALPGALAG